MSLINKLFGSKQSISVASNLVRNLMSTNMSIREAAISQVIQNKDKKSLEAVEDAIKRLTGKQKIEFYKPGGIRAGSPKEAYDKLVQLAKKKKFSDDPANIQSLIIGVSLLNNNLMQELSNIDAKELAIYQLLGVQMQLNTYLG